MHTRSGRPVFGVGLTEIREGRAYVAHGGNGQLVGVTRGTTGAFRLLPEHLLPDEPPHREGADVVWCQDGTRRMVPNVPEDRTEAVIEAIVGGSDPLAARDNGNGY